MKKLMVIIFMAAFAVVSLQGTKSAEAFTFTYDVAYTGDTPSGVITADFDQDGANSVTLTMDASALTGEDEFLTTWYFNYDDGSGNTTLADVRFTYDTGDINPLAVTSDFDANGSETHPPSLKAPGDGNYDITLVFQIGDEPDDGRFEAGEIIVYDITLEGGGPIDADWFYDWSSPEDPTNNGPFLSVIHVQGVGDGEGSGHVAAVPEPTTVFLLGSGLVGLALYGRKRFRKETDKG